MIDFFKRLFNPEPSSVTARERLRLVLLSDHLALAPDVVESLKHDLIAVISKYVDVDAANCDVTFEQQDRQVAMLANIPILGMKPATRSTPPGPPAAASPASAPPEPPASFGDATPAPAAVIDTPELVPTTTVATAPVMVADASALVAEAAEAATVAAAIETPAAADAPAHDALAQTAAATAADAPAAAALVSQAAEPAPTAKATATKPKRRRRRRIHTAPAAG
jgi:cell division topological specificity factor